MTEISQTTPIAETRSMRPFFIIWTGQAISIFGSELAQFALIWYLTVQSHSAIVLTLATLIQILPGQSSARLSVYGLTAGTVAT